MTAYSRRSGRLSMETDSTIRDIWQYSQQQAETFDPQKMNEAVDMRRRVRQEALRPADRFSLDSHNEDTPELRPARVSHPGRRISAGVNLQKSLQLLDEAVGSPSPLLRSATPTSRRTTAATPSAAQHLEMSAILLSTPGRSMIASPGTTSTRMQHSFGESGMESVAQYTPGRTTFFDSRMEEDLTTTNVALLLEEDPGLAASDGVFEAFLKLLRQHPSEHQVFELLAEYQNICQEHSTNLKKLLKRVTPGQAKFAKIREALDQLMQEKHTWHLIGLLFKDRLECANQQLDEPMMTDTIGQQRSEKQLVSALYERDTAVRQAQLVVDWLEKGAEEDLDDYYNRFEFFADQTGTWENTLHMLQQKKGGIPFGSDRPMVDEMDPDAPIRQRRPLADLDEEDELRLTRYLFVYVRAGCLEEAQKLCMRCGQAWRAATLEGWRLYHDPNYEGSAAEVKPVEGNPNRDVWKGVCWKLSEDERFSMYERSMYAALSGNLKQLLPACNSWNDYVWAYFRVFVDTRVEQEIRINSTSGRTLEELPPSYWDKVMSAESIFREIQASPNEQVQMESRLRFAILQKCLILADVDALIEEIYEWVKDDNMRLPRHLLRFNAHLILFLRTVGVCTKEELCVAILEAYVGDLIEIHQVDLVAAYVATLPQGLQVEWYAKFLEGVQEAQERKHCLDLAEEAGLDVQSITKLVVENIRDKADFSLDSDTAVDHNITEEDRQKIDAIDWLVFYPIQRAEAIRQANAVMRTFLASRKLAAAREVFNKIPAGSIDTVIKTWQMQTGSTELCAEDDNAIREYLCIQAYLVAHDSFNDWFEHYHNAKPAKPQPPAGSNFTERIAHEHKLKQYQGELDRWQHSLLLQSKTMVERMYNVLLFVDGGWMVDQRKDAMIDEQRTHQMSLLRGLCLPTICFLMHTVLHTTGQYKECLQLADTIASEQHQLYKVFQHSDLQKLLQKLSESSVALLDKSCDPLGYHL